MDFENLIKITTLLANVATAGSVMFVANTFSWERRVAREKGELETYAALQSQYTDFLHLCLEHSDLGVQDFKPGAAQALSEAQATQRMLIFEIWVSMCESAFFHYSKNHGLEFRSRQWTGWVQYMRDWAEREDFREAWTVHLCKQFDSKFVSFLDALILVARKEHSRPLPPSAP